MRGDCGVVVTMVKTDASRSARLPDCKVPCQTDGARWCVFQNLFCCATQPSDFDWRCRTLIL